MLAFPPLLRTAEDLLHLYPDKIPAFLKTNYPEQLRTFKQLGGKLIEPKQLERHLLDMDVKSVDGLWVYPEAVKMNIRKLDDDFYATSVLWLLCNQTVAPWDVKMIDEAMQLYYAGIIWTLVEL